MSKEEAVLYMQEIYDFLVENYGYTDCPDEWLLAIECIMEDVANEKG